MKIQNHFLHSKNLTLTKILLQLSEKFYRKAKLLLPTLVALPIAVNLVIIFLRWLTDTYLGSSTILEESWSLTVPLCISPIFIWFFVVPKLSVFNFPKEQRTSLFINSLLIYIFLILVCGFTQTYYTNSSDTITTLQQIEQINDAPPTRYYRLQKANLARIQTSAFVKYYTSNKAGTLNMDIYFTIPIFSPGKLNLENTPYWYGVKFHRTMKNRQDAASKDSLAKRFFIECREELNTYTTAGAPYLIRSPNSKMNIFFMKAIQHKLGSASHEPVILIHPQEENFKKRNNTSLIGMFVSYLIALAIGLIPAFSSKTTSKEN